LYHFEASLSLICLPAVVRDITDRKKVGEVA
jgi:hypothetical protein